MLLPKSARSSVLLALALLCLPGCMTLEGQRWKPRVESCQQARPEIPDWPKGEYAAYALELLGVIREDRRMEAIERECVRKL